MISPALAAYVACAERNNERAHVVLRDVHMARCTDMANHLCDWRTLPGTEPADVETLAADHVARFGHVVAVIDDGDVTTLMPKEGAPELP